MKKQDFDSISRSEQWEVLSTHLDDLKNSVRSRIGILPQIAALSATLIVVATLNKELVPLSAVEARFLLSIFLWLIPLTLHIYVYDLSTGEKKNMASIEEFLGHNISEELSKNQTITGKIIAYAPKIVAAIFYLVVLYLMLKIWAIT